MKKVIFSYILGLALFLPSASFADTYVNGYTKSNGTYVQGYYRSSPNSTRNDNYSTKGNQNPYTGSYGTKPRDTNSYGSYDNSKSRKSTGGYRNW